jgi:hypothetical protein
LATGLLRRGTGRRTKSKEIIWAVQPVLTVGVLTNGSRFAREPSTKIIYGTVFFLRKICHIRVFFGLGKQIERLGG